MARLTREQSQAQTREKLLASAQEMVGLYGYEGASVERIAEGAGYSNGAFYSNFSSKEDIFLQLLEYNAGNDVVELEKLLGKHEDPHQVIDALSQWANLRSKNHRWGVLAIELMRRARRDETIGERHLKIFRDQWTGLGNILIGKLFSGHTPPASAFHLGGTVFELTYGGIGDFLDKRVTGAMVKAVLTSMHEAHTAKSKKNANS
jgi:AcrR family transcriptional regulator